MVGATQYDHYIRICAFLKRHYRKLAVRLYHEFALKYYYNNKEKYIDEVLQNLNNLNLRDEVGCDTLFLHFCVKTFKRREKNEGKYLRRILSESRVTTVASVACSEISFARASDVFPCKWKPRVKMLIRKKKFRPSLK